MANGLVFLGVSELKNERRKNVSATKREKKFEEKRPKHQQQSWKVKSNLWQIRQIIYHICQNLPWQITRQFAIADHLPAYSDSTVIG